MSNLIIQSRPWVFLPELAKAVGLKEAIILQQFHWVMVDAGVQELRLSMDAWCEIFYFIPRKTLRTTLGRMVEAGLLSKKPQDGGALIWAINYPAVKLSTGKEPQHGQNGQAGGQSGQEKGGQNGQADLFIRYILKNNIYPLNGDVEKLDFEQLRRQAPHELFITWWNAIARQHGLEVCTNKKAGRAKAVARVMSEGIMDHLVEVEKGLRENPWYSGANDKTWIASVDWLLTEGKWQQVARFVNQKRGRPLTYKEALKYCEKHMLSTDLPKHFEKVEQGGNKKPLWRLKV